jgi:dihydroorotate dehydrogenase electron transfer subunit
MPTYADRAWQGVVLIDENVALARDTYRVRVRCPEIARRVLPGQFVMLRLPGSNDPLLGRPLAVYDVVLDAAGQPVGLDIVYLVVGKMTGQLAQIAPGSLLEAWGPLGNGFPPIETEHLVIVAGGIGQTPFLMLAQEYLGQRRFGDPPRGVAPAAKVTFCYGARSKEYLAGVDDFQRLGVDVHLATDDGSVGHHGLVTELIRPVVESSPGKCRLVCCGPEAMMKAVAATAAELGVDCQVSLETPMACGIGVCFSCVAKVRDASGGWDYRRTCVEGPVFDARDIIF